DGDTIGIEQAHRYAPLGAGRRRDEDSRPIELEAGGEPRSVERRPGHQWRRTGRGDGFVQAEVDYAGGIGDSFPGQRLVEPAATGQRVGPLPVEATAQVAEP